MLHVTKRHTISYRGLVLGVSLFLLLAVSCAAPNAERRSTEPTGAAAKAGIPCCTMDVTTPAQRTLARSAARFVGAPHIQVQGRRFRYDCSGLVRAVYFSSGIDLTEGVQARDQENGVRLIRRYIQEHGRLHHGPVIQPGDLVLFHNTWDADRDGRLDDRWTHIGIVERVEQDGTVTFISRVSRGIERYRMNLLSPSRHRSKDGTLLNDFLRRKRWRDPAATRYLTGELFAAFGTLTH